MGYKKSIVILQEQITSLKTIVRNNDIAYTKRLNDLKKNHKQNYHCKHKNTKIITIYLRNKIREPSGSLFFLIKII